MKNIIYTTVTLAVMLLSSSCQKEDAYNVNEGEGVFSLAINVDDSKTTATRATLTESELIAGASVKIYKPANQGLIREYTYGSMPGVVYLPASTAEYRVDVAAGEIVKTTERRKANFEQKSYKGSAEFMVEAGEVTNSVTVVAEVCNAITNATFDPTIAENFQDGYTLTFALRADAEDGDKLIYTAAESGSDGYFIIDNAIIEKSLHWTFAGTLKDGTTFTKSGIIEPKDREGNAVPLTGAKLTMNFKYSVKDGFLLFNLDVKTGFDDDDVKQDFIIWAPVSTGIIPLVEGDPNIWAKFVTVSADVDTETYDASKVYFQYRKQGETAWSDISDDIKATATAKEGVYSAVLKGLDPNTQYEYQLVLYTKDTTTTNDAGETVTVSAAKTVIGDADNDGNADEPATFTTESAPAIPNGNFEGYNEDNGYPAFYYTGTEKWWDSGNAISSDFGAIICTTDIGANGTKKCALLQSQVVLNIKLAAGNIFSGSSGGQISGSTHGAVHFGRPFTGRPTGITFYIKYCSGEVDKVGDSDLTKGENDKGQFKVALGRWGDTSKYASHDTNDMTSPVQVRTDKLETFWKIGELQETIVYRDIITDKNTGWDKWKKVTWKFDYKNEDVPTHIIISGAASQYGDYYGGSSNSRMWLDEIELLYDHPDKINEGIIEIQ